MWVLDIIDCLEHYYIVNVNMIDRECTASIEPMKTLYPTYYNCNDRASCNVHYNSFCMVLLPIFQRFNYIWSTCPFQNHHHCNIYYLTKIVCYFCSTVDREKKTVVESPVTKPTSLLNRERTREFVSKQQVLKLRGLRMIDGGQLAPAPSTYLRPTAMPLKSLEDFYRYLGYQLAHDQHIKGGTTNRCSNRLCSTQHLLQPCMSIMICLG